MKLTGLILLLSVFCFPLNAQYVDEDGRVKKDKVIAELKQLPDGSPEQRAYADSLAPIIRKEIVSHYFSNQSENGQSHDMFSVSLMERRMGDFTFLRREGYGVDTDTVSTEVLALESQMEALKDSLHTLYEQLIDITRRGDAESRATKEKAALMIGKSPFIEHIEYVFENDSDLSFGLIVNERLEPIIDCWGCQRSGLVGLVSGLSPEEKEIYRWRVMPFLIEYWGRPGEYTATHYPFEFVTFANLTHKYKNPHLLLEFMRSNAEDPNSGIYQHLDKYFGE